MARPESNLKNPYLRIALFAGIFLLIHLGILGVFYNYVQYQANLRYRVDKMFKAEADTLSHLFIGSSRTNKAIETDSFHQAFKFFGPTETAPYHYYRAKYLLEHHPWPIRQIIFPAEYGVLAFNSQPLQYLGLYWKRYINFAELGMHTAHPFYYMGLGVKISVFPYYQHPAGLLVLRDLRKNKVIWRYFQRPSWKDYSPLEQNMIMAFVLARHFTFGSLVSPTGIDYFEMMTRLSNPDKVQLVFLKYPLRKEYYENIERVDPRAARYNRWIDSLVETTPGAVLLDCMKMYDDRPELFLDPHHLNKAGKAEFSGWLSDTLESLLRQFEDHKRTPDIN